MVRFSATLLTLLLLASLAEAESGEIKTTPKPPGSAFAARLPLSFEPNRGQTAPQVRYLARGPGFSLYLTVNESVLVLQHPGARERVLRLQLLGARRESQFSGEVPLPGISNYFSGGNSRNGHTRIPHFARVRLQGVYPGVDLVYYGNSGQLEYDFRVQPGSDPSRIAMRVEGADTIALDAGGALVLTAGDAELRQQAPTIYQEKGGQRIPRTGRFVVHADNTIGFQVDDYDRSRTLVIDPVLRFSTYLGGSSGGTDQFQSASGGGLGVAVDKSGFVYVVGNTTAVDFPTTPGSFEPACPGGTAICTVRFAVFVTKLNRTGTQLVYSTYLTSASGTGFDVHSGKLIAVDRLGNAHIGGTAFGGAGGDVDENDFPTTTTAFQRKCAFETDATCAFYVKLNSDGSQLLYSTYYGRGFPDIHETTATGLALDRWGNAYLTGVTEVQDLPTTADVFQPAFGGGRFDAFVAKFNPHLAGDASLVYGTYLGGSDDEQANAIAVDHSGRAYVAGTTTSNNFPHTREFGTGAGGTFMVKLSRAGRSLLFSNLVHGASATGIAVDKSGKVYVAGGALAGFPTTAGALQRDFGGGSSDAFVAKFNRAGSRLLYSTFFGGNDTDLANSIALDSRRHVFIAGSTSSTNLPVTHGSLQTALRGPSDGFVAELRTAGNGLVFSTYLGGGDNDSAGDIACDRRGSAYITGGTNSTDFPVTPGAFQGTIRGAPSSAFVAKISPKKRKP